MISSYSRYNAIFTAAIAGSNSRYYTDPHTPAQAAHRQYRQYTQYTTHHTQYTVHYTQYKGVVVIREQGEEEKTTFLNYPRRPDRQLVVRYCGSVQGSCRPGRGERERGIVAPSWIVVT